MRRNIPACYFLTYGRGTGISPRSSRGAAAAGETITARNPDRTPRAVWVIAAVSAVVLLAVSDRYGFQQDELYFVVASHHLAFGYVDQPPEALREWIRDAADRLADR